MVVQSTSGCYLHNKYLPRSMPGIAIPRTGHDSLDAVVLGVWAYLGIHITRR